MREKLQPSAKQLKHAIGLSHSHSTCFLSTSPISYIFLNIQQMYWKHNKYLPGTHINDVAYVDENHLYDKITPDIQLQAIENDIRQEFGFTA